MAFKEDSVHSNIIKLLSEEKPGKTFVYDDFSECGTYAAIRSAVVKLCKEKYLLRICQGVYIKPSPTGENILPDNITLAIEIDRRSGAKATIKEKSRKYSREKTSIGSKELHMWSTGSSRRIKLPDGTVVKYFKTT